MRGRAAHIALQVGLVLLAVIGAPWAFLEVHVVLFLLFIALGYVGVTGLISEFFGLGAADWSRRTIDPTPGGHVD